MQTIPIYDPQARLRTFSQTPFQLRGAGLPEKKVSAPVGSIYTDTTAPAVAVLEQAVTGEVDSGDRA